MDQVSEVVACPNGVSQFWDEENKARISSWESGG